MTSRTPGANHGRPDPRDRNKPHAVMGAMVVRLRQDSGISRPQLAELSGIPYPLLANLETGRRRLSDKLAVKISAALGVDLPELLEARNAAEHAALAVAEPVVPLLGGPRRVAAPAPRVVPEPDEDVVAHPAAVQMDPPVKPKPAKQGKRADGSKKSKQPKNAKRSKQAGKAGKVSKKKQRKREARRLASLRPAAAPTIVLVGFASGKGRRRPDGKARRRLLRSLVGAELAALLELVDQVQAPGAGKPKGGSKKSRKQDRRNLPATFVIVLNR